MDLSETRIPFKFQGSMVHHYFPYQNALEVTSKCHKPAAPAAASPETAAWAAQPAACSRPRPGATIGATVFFAEKGYQLYLKHFKTMVNIQREK